MTEVQRTATKLGLLRRKAVAGSGVPDFADREHELLTKLAEARMRLTPAAAGYPVNVAHTAWGPVPDRAAA